MKKKKIKISWAAAAVCFLLLLFGVTLYSLAAFRESIQLASHQDFAQAESYGAYYALISENDDTLLWNSIYRGAKKEGMENGGAHVEFFGGRLSLEPTVQEKLRMAVDAGVDGIILNWDGDAGTEELVQEAAKEGIPVVTVLDDGATDVRQCFVGVNSYHLGQEYAGRIWKLLQDMEENCQIQVLLNSGDTDPGKNTLFLGLRDTLEELAGKEGKERELRLDTIAVDRNDAFQAEEAIRRLMVEDPEEQKILVCLSEADTRRAYEAVIDHNRVGEVRILGYYESRQVLEGIEKDIIDSTITVDGEQVGRLCVQALTEYRNNGHVNAYLPVDVYLIDQSNVSDYLEQNEE